MSTATTRGHGVSACACARQHPRIELVRRHASGISGRLLWDGETNVRSVSTDERSWPAPPSIARVADLAASLTDAGVETCVRILGHRRSLSAAVERAAFWIIQESLVNVLKDAGFASASVLVAYEPGRVVVEIRNERDRKGDVSVQSDRVRAGHAIVGMRERAVAVGGTLEAVPCPEGGFWVRACLPNGFGS